MNDINSYEKGLSLEKKIYELFSKQGYQVTHNIKKVGRSGTTHQIDVFAEYRSPLHKSIIIVEVKSLSSPIDKDKIMKLIQIVNDLGADRGIIITTSYFTASANTTANGHNIDLWDRGRLSEIIGEVELKAAEKGLTKQVETTDRYLKFTTSPEKAKLIMDEILQKQSKGGFLGVGKINEELLEISKIYFPVYELEIRSKSKEKQRTGMFSTKEVEKIFNTKVWVDGINGYLIKEIAGGLSFPYNWIWDLKEEEVSVIKFVGKSDFLSKNLAALGYSEGKVRKLVSSLVSKGFLNVKGGRPVVYTSNVEFPDDPRLVIAPEISNLENNEKDLQTKTIEHNVNVSSVNSLLKHIWNIHEIKNILKIYYPLYSYILKSEDGTKRIQILDGVFGTLNENIAKNMTFNENIS